MLLITRPRSGTAGVLCEVVRETSQRCYVRIVQRPTKYDWYPSWVVGRGNELYVAKEGVAFFDVTEADYAAYLGVWNAYKQQLDALEEEYQRQNEELREKRKADLEALFQLRRVG